MPSQVGTSNENNGNTMHFVSVNARIFRDTSGAYEETPVLIGPDGIITPVMEYCLSSARSLAWKKKLILAVSLFLEYWEANSETPFGYRLFDGFAHRLHTGTFNIETSLDPSGLCWLPRKTQYANELIELLSSFFDWWAKENPAAEHPNPMVPASSSQRKIQLAAIEFRRQRSFLGHLWKKPDALSRRLQKQGGTKVISHTPPRFPDSRFEELLLKGFKVGGKLNYRDILITLLLNKGGFRGSEPMHLWVEDVFPDPEQPNSAMVLIYHPTRGAAPSTWTYPDGRKRKGNRQEYLAEKFGLPARTQMLGKKSAGWKNPTLDDDALWMRAFWFEPVYGEWFLHFWDLYMRELAAIPRKHPYAFVNIDREPFGHVYSMAQYSKSLAGAVRRLGMPVGKAFGTTPHGHRHAFGWRTKQGGLSEIEIQRMMHHRSPESQKQYTQPSHSDVRLATELAYERLKQKSDHAAISNSIENCRNAE